MLGFSGALYAARGNHFTTELMGPMAEALLRQPDRWAAISEQVGGEFWFGAMPQGADFPDQRRTVTRALGLQAVLPVGKRWAVQGEIAATRFHATATFPVLVSPASHGNQQWEGNGEVNAAVTGFLAGVAGRYYWIGPRFVRPFVSLGAQYERQGESRRVASIAGITWEAGTAPARSGWSGLLQAGGTVTPPRGPWFGTLGAGVRVDATGLAPVFALAAGYKW